jgi:hypothetical protein
MATDTVFVQVFSLLMGIVFVLCGILGTYVSYLGVKGRIKPNGAMGTRFNFSKDSKLFNQDKYWYDINRYGGKLGLYWSLLWALLGMVLVVLPVGGDQKLLLSLAIIIFICAGFIVIGWRSYRYANKLISAPAGH